MDCPLPLQVGAPATADALAQARMVTISGGEDGGAASRTTNQIAIVIQTIIAAQLVGRGGMIGGPNDGGSDNGGSGGNGSRAASS